MPANEKHPLAIVVSALLLWASSAGAQTYPAKTVCMVAPFAAGGGTDLIGRLCRGEGRIDSADPRHRA